MIEVSWGIAEDAEQPLSDAEVAGVAEHALTFGERPGAGLSIVLVDDATLAEMHDRHLGDPTETDVITFDLGGDGEGPIGELFVSVECARRVASRRGVLPARELALYVVHGVLHLCGFDDSTEQERTRMRAAEAQVLVDLGYVPDEREHEYGTE